MAWSARKILALALIFAIGVFSSGAWYVFGRGVVVEEASTFIMPTLWFLPFFLTLLLGSLVWQEKTFTILAVALSVFPSVLQTPTLVHALIATFSAGLLFIGLRRIQEEVRERIHFSFKRSLAAGMSMLVLGVSLTLSSQYFMHTRLLPWDRLVPSFDLAEGAGPFLLRLLQPLYPEIAKFQDKTVTVDDFLKQVQTTQMSTTLSQLPQDTQNAYWTQELARTKQQLSQLLGREVTGRENMQTLLTEVLRKKTIAFVSEENNHLPVPILPFFLSLLLLLTVYPLLAFLMPVVGGIAHLIFQICVWAKWIQITKRVVEQEVIKV